MKQINEHQLRQLAGWSPRSQMHLKYIHYFGNEASESLLEAYGIVTSDKELANTLHINNAPIVPNRINLKISSVLVVK